VIVRLMLESKFGYGIESVFVWVEVVGSSDVDRIGCSVEDGIYLRCVQDLVVVQR